MLRKHAIITALITIGLILGVSLSVSVYRNDLILKSWVEYVWMISMGFGFVGYLCRGGALKGDTIQRTEGVLRTSENKEGFIEADDDDARVGFAFGMVVMLSSILVFCGSLAALHFYFTE